VTEAAGGPRSCVDVDVVLPALDEAAALPALLPRFPAGYRPIVVDNGSTDDTAVMAAGHGALVVAEPVRGFGSACYAGLLAATAPVVCFMDADGSFDPTELPLVAGPVVAGAADLVLGARRAQPGAWPLHARVANRVLAAELRRRAAVGLTDLGPMRAAARLGPAGVGTRRPPVGLAVGDGAPRRPSRLAHRRGARLLSTESRSLEGHRHGPGDDSRRERYGPGARQVTEPIPSTEVALAVLAKAPLAGRSKTRCCPPCTPEQAARLAEAALSDTLVTVAATPAARRVVVLDGAPGAWLPPGFEVIEQRTGGLDERLAGAVVDIADPVVVIGMDTPQLTPVLLGAVVASLGADGVDAVLAPATDGGYWAVGLRRPDRRAFLGVAMSRPDTGERQRARLAALGLAVAGPAGLPWLTDVDTWDDAVAVAADGDGPQFRSAVAAVSAELYGRDPDGRLGARR
jgi:glycosyltransferase A (GT-A) superfamily protein (DUF2064 family)